jgi:ATP-dependent DNA helicase PIF1
MGSVKQLVHTEFVTGSAGTGKSFTMKQRAEENPGAVIICATTGVSAVNMNTTTINSLLKYFNTQDLVDKYINGHLARHLKMLLSPNREVTIVVDEVSMMHAEQLDTIYNAIYAVNRGGDQGNPPPYPLGLALTGDFCQLPPVGNKKWVGGKAKTIKPHWAFEAECWPEFAKTTTRLTKVWRQQDPQFLEAINAARRGEGSVTAANLRSLGAQFALNIDMNYDGTTIMAKNDAVDRYNQQRLLQVREQSFAVETRRWGLQQPDWKNIPDRAIFKPTALVMLLANKKYPVEDTGHESAYQYVNGDQAHIVDYDERHGFEVWEQNDFDDGWHKDLKFAAGIEVTSVRTDETFWLAPVVRESTIKAGPDDMEAVLDEVGQIKPELLGDPTYRPAYDDENKRWVVGTIEYFPLRLAYASTVHKTQGLTLDRIQIDCRDGFFGAPSMAYVALSRARSIEGMRVVGTPDLLARRIKFNEDVRQWL